MWITQTFVRDKTPYQIFSSIDTKFIEGLQTWKKRYTHYLIYWYFLSNSQIMASCWFFILRWNQHIISHDTCLLIKADQTVAALKDGSIQTVPYINSVTKKCNLNRIWYFINFSTSYLNILNWFFVCIFDIKIILIVKP